MGGGIVFYRYEITNLQGDVVMLVDADGNEVARYTYDPYGNILSATGTMAEINPLRYRGYYYDAETGMYYLQSRYYDPVVGRFINADSYMSTGQGFLGYNMFAYCNNNPVNCEDETGCNPFGILTLWDYYMIHRAVQFECLARRGYDMEVSVKTATGGRGRLDLYDYYNNEYYEVKSEGAYKNSNTPKQMLKYDSSKINARRYKHFNISQSPTRGTNYISGTIPYGLYDVDFELREAGIIVYDPQINWTRTTAFVAVTVALALAPETGGASIPMAAPAFGMLFPVG